MQAYERVMIRDLPIFTLGAETSNKLIGWVDSDFGSDPDTRKSMTGYLMPLNALKDLAISKRSLQYYWRIMLLRVS